MLAAADTIIHRIWLGNLYQGLAHFWRPAEEMKANAWLPFLSEFALAFLLAVIYPIGREKKPPLEQGLRFGILMGLLVHLPSVLIKYYLYPYPRFLFVAWFVGGVLEVAIAGLAVALVYQKD